jgi:cephalosporin hydroxylase
MGRLTNIANDNTVDKGTEHYEKHGYTELYDKYIPETGKYILLEIGIWHGDSLRMWEEYNPELVIHGIDIDPNVYNFIQVSNKSIIHIGDQSNKEFIEKVISTSGYLDFIIDDGSHQYDHIIASFKILWDYLKVGGFYFIEDLHAPYARKNDAIKTIIEWLNINNKKYSSLDLTCGEKMLIIQK